MSMFSGFMSRWKIPFLCMWSIAAFPNKPNIHQSVNDIYDYLMPLFALNKHWDFPLILGIWVDSVESVSNLLFKVINLIDCWIVFVQEGKEVCKPFMSWCYETLHRSWTLAFTVLMELLHNACTFCEQKRRITYKRTSRSLMTFGWGDSLCNAWISRKLVTWSTSLLTSVTLDDMPGMCGVYFCLWRFGCGSLAQEVYYKIIRVNKLHGCIIAL